tara:strand:- start:21942 stop:25814 length:3873 start_codon:yes stop_codon:yes gene_type:complete
MTSRKRSKADDLKAFVTTDPSPVVESNRISTEFRKLVSEIDKIYQKSVPDRGAQNSRRDLKISELSSEDLDDVLALIQKTVNKRKTTANPERAYAANSFPSTNIAFTQDGEEDEDEVLINPSEFDERVANEIANPQRVRGISTYRPEILMLTDYENSVPGSPAAEMIDLQVNSRYVRADAIEALIKELDQDPDAESAKILQRLRDKFNEDLDDILREVNFLKSFFETRDNLDSAMSIVSDQDSITAECQKLRDQTIKKSKVIREIEDLQESKSINEFLVQDLGFNPENIKTKTGSTAFLQILSDLHKNIVEIYRYDDALVEQEELRFNLDDDYEIVRKARSRFRADWANKFYKGSGRPFIPVKKEDMSLFRNKRASSYRTPGELATAVSQYSRFITKEYTISSGLDNSNIQTILSEEFNESLTGDVFDGITGIPGETALSRPQYSKPDSVAALARRFERVNNRNIKVFPFESTPLPNNSTTSKTGKQFYVDSITKTKDKNINLNPASQFKDQALDKSEAAYEVMNTLLGHDGTGVFAQELVDEIIKSIAKLFDVLNPTDNVETYDPSMALQLALLTWISNWQPGIYVAAELVQQILLLKALKRFESGTSNSIAFEKMSNLDEPRLLSILKGRPWTRNELPDDVKNGTTPLGNFAYQHIYARTLSDWVGQKYPYADSISNPNQDTTDDAFQVRIRYRDSAATAFFGASITASNSIFSEILGVVEKLDEKVKERGNPYRPDNDAGTRFNNISPSSLIAAVMSIYSMIIQKMPRIIFHPSFGVKNQGDRAQRQFYVHIDKQETLDFKQSLDQYMQGGLDAVDPQSQLSQFLRSLNRILEKDISINLNSLEIMRSIPENIAKRYGSLALLTDPEGPSAESLTQIFGEDNAKQKLSVVDEPQLVLGINSLENYLKFKTDENPVFFPTDLIDSSTRKALKKFATMNRPRGASGQPEISLNGPKSKNVKMITVGLPAGLTSFITKKTRQEIRQGQGNQKDIVDVNVYMKNLNYDKLIFKPATFSFELSRFFKGLNEIPDDNTMNFEQIIQEFGVTRDIQVNRDPQVLDTVGFALPNRDQYSEYSNETMNEVIFNTVQSHFCHLYLKLLTGIDPSESSFLYVVNDEAQSLQSSDLAEFNALVQGHVSNLAPGLTLDQIALQNPEMRDVVRRIKTGEKTQGVLKEVSSEIANASRDQNIKISEDLVNLSKLVSPQSALTSPGVLRKKALTPKLFERVFTVLVDPDSFEIDGDRTSYRDRVNLIRSGILSGDGRRFTSSARYLNRATLNQFFVTVSRREQ